MRRAPCRSCLFSEACEIVGHVAEACWPGVAVSYDGAFSKRVKDTGRGQGVPGMQARCHL
eukprot:1904689-Lingulodinium_polyedra.AAC.1